MINIDYKRLIIIFRAWEKTGSRENSAWSDLQNITRVCNGLENQSKYMNRFLIYFDNFAEAEYMSRLYVLNYERMLTSIILMEKEEGVIKHEIPETFDAYAFSEICSQRNKEWMSDKSDWSLLEFAGAMCGEAGEAANVAKKIKRITDGIDPKLTLDDLPMLRGELMEELADTVTYAVIIADELKEDLWLALTEKFNKVSERTGLQYKIDINQKGEKDE